MATFRTRGKTQKGKPRWRVQVYVGRHPTTGKPRYIAATFDTKEKAKEWAAEKEQTRRQGKAPATEKRTVAEYLEHWLRKKTTGQVRGKRKGHKRPRTRTISDYKAALQRWVFDPPKGVRMIGSVRVDKVSSSMLEDFYESMTTVTTPDTVMRLHKLLAQAFEHAVRERRLPYNPTDNANPPLPAGDQPTPERHMTPEQVRAFLTAARDDRYSALWHLLTETGLRPGEALGLEWKYLDLDGTKPAVHVRQNLVRTPKAHWKTEQPKTPKAKRMVYLLDDTVRELRKWRKQQQLLRDPETRPQHRHNFVFTGSSGEPLYSVPRKRFVRIMARAELGEWGPEPPQARKGPTEATTILPCLPRL